MSQRISVFDMIKIGVGPSSSHTMGPWRAAEQFLKELKQSGHFDMIRHVQIDLYGSLAKTGKGHGTDIAVLMGLMGHDPTTCNTGRIREWVNAIYDDQSIKLLQEKDIFFDVDEDLIFHFDQSLPEHPNGIRFSATLEDGQVCEETYFSIGGGFVVKQGDDASIKPEDVKLPYPADYAYQVQAHCNKHNIPIWKMVWENEQAWRSDAEVEHKLRRIWDVMVDCIYRGCHSEGTLPGGLNVKRRAPEIHRRLIGDVQYNSRAEWMAYMKSREYTFHDMIKWISCFALAVNEENAAFGRIVTAPTNGAAGVIPAVLMYYVCFYHVDIAYVERFLMVAGEIGTLFKKNATISAAMGGCQAEIGVSSAMAAAALTECLGGTVEQTLMAAEIAMEHHLGLTCDPIGGLVQVPCIERNAMGAMKAITASNIALESSPEHAKVSLDAVIKTMWETAKDMNDKYKETSEGGLAVNIPVNVAEC